MLWYLVRTFLLHPLRPGAKAVAEAERSVPGIELAPREVRRAEVEATAV